MGVTPKQFKDDNVKLGDILKYNLELYSIKELIDGGYTIADFKLLFNLNILKDHFTLEQLKPPIYTKDELDDYYTIDELKELGIN